MALTPERTVSAEIHGREHLYPDAFVSGSGRLGGMLLANSREWMGALMISSSQTPFGAHPNEPHRGDLAGRLNWLRAGVLGS